MSNLQVVRIGLVGCGIHASESILPALVSIRSAHLVAACDPQPRNLAAVRDRCPEVNTYADFDELLSRQGIDAVIAVGPPQVHFQIARAAMRQNVHVFVEKPPTVTSAELAELATYAAERKLVTCVGHNLRYAEAVREMRYAASRPGFGRPVGMEVRYLASKPRGERWGLPAVRSFLLSHVIHALDLMVSFLGPVSDILASGFVGPGGPVNVTASLRFESGGVGALFTSSAATRFSLGASLLGSGGAMAELRSLSDVKVIGASEERSRWGRYWQPRTLAAGHVDAGYRAELLRFIAAVRRGWDAAPSFRDELPVYRVIDALEAQLNCGGADVLTHEKREVR